MRLCLIICVTLLAGCGDSPRRSSPPPVQAPPPVVIPQTPIADPALFRPCDGWTGPPPVTDLQIALAAEAEIAGRERCNDQLNALAEVYGVQP
jgi:hypothetical protein